MIESIQNFADSFPDWLQWAGVLLVSAIPFVESYFGAVIGVAIGLHPVVAILVAVIGNVISMLAFVYGAGAIRDKATKNKDKDAEPSQKRQRLKRMFDKFGVPGVSLLGQTLLPSQITSMAMVGFGANRNIVAFWQIISIILWGVLFGVLATLGIELALR
ncbi:MAG: hypothetical protein ACTMKZ_06630 [Brevibacterium aurantiacum]|uniref:Small multidrug efflux protein n=1 Tax=Brevibacterium aurantiacum TaxID=273384 RepID=A0A1D7W898_BREAU|nr:hypothetical protein [Brevibacterium aurantiacum]MDN5592963.1 hypothetical protein [Brevibacterium sp.]AOP55185.1 hypothetical protein BLSMQ_3485 [Brevibacterium aurantiacum]AZL07070.1 hypothetical protein CXR24_16935 [Brevibacterium aurantiacum]AZL14305.1 hypothetical protein CXR25_16855 [Brevibacterium aurantiacum]AZT94889.1 hypothetical protein CXR23_18515 [Brevibacterium aurantiacum]